MSQSAAAIADEDAPAARAVSRPGAGRPTREQAERRNAELLAAALDMFLERGFELTTIDAICAEVGMTKRTVYARYEDKASLFRAAVQRAVIEWNVPISALDTATGETLESVLATIARMRVGGALASTGLKLQRLLNAEAWRFPDIFELAYRQGTLPAVAHVARLFEQAQQRGEIVAEDPEALASGFLAFVVGGITRGAVLGRPISEEQIDAHINFGVRLFLDGARPR